VGDDGMVAQLIPFIGAENISTTGNTKGSRSYNCYKLIFK
jgi:hypothetical protein